jgi:hypothetical protein
VPLFIQFPTNGLLGNLVHRALVWGTIDAMLRV